MPSSKELTLRMVAVCLVGAALLLIARPSPLVVTRGATRAIAVASSDASRW
jgi:hypothetical protein